MSVEWHWINPGLPFRLYMKNNPGDMPGSTNSSVSVSECPICLGSFVNPVFTPCGHRFCQFCILSHISVSRLTANFDDRNQIRSQLSSPACPLCRYPISGFTATSSAVQGSRNAQVLRQGLNGGRPQRPWQHNQNQRYTQSSALPLRPSDRGGGGGRGNEDGDGDRFSVTEHPSATVNARDTEVAACPSFVCPNGPRRFLTFSGRPAQRGGDSKSSKLVVFMRNLIVSASLIVVICLCVVCLWENSIDLKRTKEKLADYPKRFTPALDQADHYERDCNDVRLLSSVSDAMRTVCDMQKKIANFVNRKKSWYRLLIESNQPKSRCGRQCQKLRKSNQVVTFQLELIDEQHSAYAEETLDELKRIMGSIGYNWIQLKKCILPPG